MPASTRRHAGGGPAFAFSGRGFAGVAILPRRTVQSEASTRTLAVVPLSIADLARPVGLIHRRQKPLTPTVSRFIQLLKDASEEPTPAIAARGARS